MSVGEKRYSDIFSQAAAVDRNMRTSDFICFKLIARYLSDTLDMHGHARPQDRLARLPNYSFGLTHGCIFYDCRRRYLSPDRASAISNTTTLGANVPAQAPRSSTRPSP
jgi:hypothetical protein